VFEAAVKLLMSDNQVTVACATPLTKNNITSSSDINAINLLNLN
jgi:hypothetical protein